MRAGSHSLVSNQKRRSMNMHKHERANACEQPPAWFEPSLLAMQQITLKMRGKLRGGNEPNRVVADVWEKDVWEFQDKSGSSGSCRPFLPLRPPRTH